ncbi:MAG TPA: LamG-like jellyroll fold domain-containing protein, partial [Pilimelia sp.]|nr:LamG-like jellyroll fold domain-containing protein [Pilimelia sp.]
DGTSTVVSALTPQRARTAAGDWADIDTTLRAGAAGLRAVSSTADVTFSAGGRGPLVTWRDGTDTFTLSWPAALPEPTVAGDTATYPEVLPGVDLTATATAEGYSYAVVVKTRAAAHEPALRSIRLTTGGSLRLRSADDGRHELIDRSGAVLAGTGRPFMWDSTFDPAAGGEFRPGQAQPSDRARLAADGVLSSAARPGVGARTARVDAILADGAVTLVPQAAMLTDPGTTFPVFIDPPLNKLRSKWAYANNQNHTWTVDNLWVGRDPSNGYLYRSFVEFDVSAVRGTTILAAEVTSVLDHSWSCSSTPLYLWRPGGNISVASGARQSWSAQPMGDGAGKYLDSWSGHANEASGCGSPPTIEPDAAVVFDAAAVKTDLQAAATGNWTLYTLGLCACDASGTNSDESTQDRWKRLHDEKTYLVATYDKAPNTPVAQPLSQTTDCYAACVSPAFVRTVQPTLRVNASDPYGGQLRTYFEVRATASATGTLIASTTTPVVGTASGAAAVPAAWQVPAAKLASGGTYYWRAYTRDENNLASAWTAFQTVTVDTTAPAAPSISSAQYPLKQWGASVGTAGTFTLTGSADVYNYTWWVDGGANTTTAASSVSYTPPKDMVHTFTAKARDKAGNTSADTDHQFWVSPLPNRCWNWRLDEAAGSTAADSGNSDPNDPVCAPIGATVTAQPGTLSGSVGFGPGYLGNAATFSGTGGQITTAGPVLDTTKSFTVMAWVRAADLSADGSQTVLGQDGVNVSRFVLRYRAQANNGAGGWCFGMRTSDAAGTQPVYACATGAVGDSVRPSVGQWVHLAGVYDATTGEIQVHVMGNEQYCSGEMVSTPFTGSWSASRAFAIGRALEAGAPAHHWRGGIDQVYAHQRVLSPAEICQQAIA